MSRSRRQAIRYVVVILATLLVGAAFILWVFLGRYLPAFVLLALGTLFVALHAWPHRPAPRSRVVDDDPYPVDVGEEDVDRDIWDEDHPLNPDTGFTWPGLPSVNPRPAMGWVPASQVQAASQVYGTNSLTDTVLQVKVADSEAESDSVPTGLVEPDMDDASEFTGHELRTFLNGERAAWEAGIQEGERRAQRKKDDDRDQP